MTIFQLNRELQQLLAPVVGSDEARATVRLMFEQLLHIRPVDIVISGERVLEPETVSLMTEIAGRVADGEPVQYVLGRATFMGMSLKVTPAVLIPRPETSQLVDLIVGQYAGRGDMRVLDIGTGSGCIAIALSRALPFAVVTAADISDDALCVARHNADALHAAVSFVHADAMRPVTLPDTPFDIIVSNPPYIAEREIADMDRRVFDHEPRTALFVPDSDPLCFYRAIAGYAMSHLSAGGGLFFEINPLYAGQLRAMLQNDGWNDVQILRDFRGAERFATAYHPKK